MRKNLLKTGIEGLGRLFYLIPFHPEVAQIEITNRCNFNCPMCQRIPLRVPIKDMGLELYKKIINKLEKVNEVILTGWGEPLMHPKLVEMVEYAKKKGKLVSLTSNGSLFTRDFARKIIQIGLDSISFSIDDIKAPREGSLVHPVTTQVRNVKDFLIIKKKNRRPEVVIQTTLHRDQDKKIFDIVAWAAKVGADMVNVNRLDVRFNQKLKRPNLLEEKEFVNKLDEVGKKYKVQTEFRPHIAFSGVARLFYRFLAPYMALGGRHCLRVYDYVYINLKGDVTPCCALPSWEVGNVLEENLVDIWRSPRMNNFRKHNFQRNICGQCDVLEVKQYA